MADKTQTQKALIFTMITMSAVDRRIDDSELQKIGNVVRQLPVFATYDEENLIKDSQECGEVLGQDDGLELVLEMISAIPANLYEMAYALAVEVAAADLRIETEEVRFLEMLSDRLGLDKLITAAIERSARARFQIL
ncbi:MAG TPA: tellurite resistance TerB family protein [Hyphomicrobiales bacterium]|nr:tellurite resistance TerB family protein [Hyphomicrobiales bacterium]